MTIKTPETHMQIDFPPVVVGPPIWGWKWQPGLHRCDRGYNAGSKSYGCREPGVRDVNGEWLCDDHADEIPARTDTVYLSCPTHRPTGLAQRSTAPGQWYWCSLCHDVWQADGRAPHASHRSAIGIGLVLVYGFTLLVVLVLGAAFWLHDHHGLTDDAAVGWGALIGLAAWFIAIRISFRVFCFAMYAAEQAWRYTWGDPR